MTYMAPHTFFPSAHVNNAKETSFLCDTETRFAQAFNEVFLDAFNPSTPWYEPERPDLSFASTSASSSEHEDAILEPLLPQPIAPFGLPITPCAHPSQLATVPEPVIATYPDVKAGGWLELPVAEAGEQGQDNVEDQGLGHLFLGNAIPFQFSAPKCNSFGFLSEADTLWSDDSSRQSSVESLADSVKASPFSLKRKRPTKQTRRNPSPAERCGFATPRSSRKQQRSRQNTLDAARESQSGSPCTTFRRIHSTFSSGLGPVQDPSYDTNTAPMPPPRSQRMSTENSSGSLDFDVEACTYNDLAELLVPSPRQGSSGPGATPAATDIVASDAQSPAPHTSATKTELTNERAVYGRMSDLWLDPRTLSPRFQTMPPMMPRWSSPTIRMPSLAS
ncbi:unnamed protein product [Parascedosporium putredinis]|uniref:Uncharacterized protein n=1 Tax=Parascedosporium putredinis TaxID=1442378 RepID=A0A9P1H309_9PEZI|nr:unnamed protein product [Parascedosporium putredinis]CAI7996493.1 unnamed protein product [Parascedosporium putredinis]